jgi:predicted  nucleic acid-binding Zn-ribbon protein
MLAVASGLGLVAGFVLAEVDSPTVLFYAMGTAIIAVGTMQVLSPGTGISLRGTRVGDTSPGPDVRPQSPHQDLDARPDTEPAPLASGTPAGAGSFRCTLCGYVIEMTAADVLPECPGCDGRMFTLDRAPLYSTTSDERIEAARKALVDSVRDALVDVDPDALDEPGRYLVFRQYGTIRTVPLRGSIRIGRSLSAEVRLDDPTVSRRHAVIFVDVDGARVLDDRSQNGVLVNGERVISHSLLDDDEIIIGRYRLRFVDLAPAQPTDEHAATQSAERRDARDG